MIGQFINPVSLSENILRAEPGFTAKKDIVFRTPPQYLDPFSFPFFSFLYSFFFFLPLCWVPYRFRMRRRRQQILAGGTSSAIAALCCAVL